MAVEEPLRGPAPAETWESIPPCRAGIPPELPVGGALIPALEPLPEAFVPLLFPKPPGWPRENTGIWCLGLLYPGFFREWLRRIPLLVNARPRLSVDFTRE